jgi:hypothetical protein
MMESRIVVGGVGTLRDRFGQRRREKIYTQPVGHEVNTENRTTIEYNFYSEFFNGLARCNLEK